MKDDSLPYVYLDDEEEGKTAKKQKKPADKRTKELPYEYVDEDKPKKPAKHKAAGGAKGTSGVKNASSAKHKATSASDRRASSGAHTVKNKKNAKKKSKAPLAVLSIVLLLVLGCLTVVLLDANGVMYIGIIDRISGKPSTAPTQSTKIDTSSVTWFTPDDDNTSDNLNQADLNSISVSENELNITPGLSSEWVNILLLGTDSRVSYEAARTDTMIICSIHQNTGEVKLTSIMRDTQIEMNGRSFKINSAYFYGGANLAMATVNKYFGLNIDKFVVVDFSGFAKIAEALGGVEMDVSEKELPYLNHNVAEQYYLLFTSGEMTEEDAKARYYETKLDHAGAKLHLDGMQALGYARIRKSDNDYTRTDRQRKVLIALLSKAKGMDAMSIMNMVTGNMQYVKTNLDIGTIVSLASKVLGSQTGNDVTTFRVPDNGTYKEEVRNNVSGLYDMDVQANITALHGFIYGQGQ